MVVERGSEWETEGGSERRRGERERRRKRGRE